MEGPLLGLGFDSPAPAENQQQSQQPNTDLFSPPQSQTQPQQPQQQQKVNDQDVSHSQQQPQQNPNVDPFGVPMNQLQQPEKEAGLSQPVAPQDQNSPANQPTNPSTQSQQLSLGVTEDSNKLLQESQQQPTNNNIAVSQTQQVVATGSNENDTSQSAEAGTPAPQTAEGNSPNGEMIDDATSQRDKARLKEIQQIFGGKWRLVRSDPFAEYLKAIGVGMVMRNRVRSGTNEVEIGTLDGHIYVNTSSLLHRQINKYKLDEALENAVMGSNFSVFCSYQDQKLEMQMTSLEATWGKTQGLQYSINEHGELMVIYTCGSHVCRRCFQKVVEATA